MVLRALRRQAGRGWQRVRSVKSPGLYIARILGRPLPDRLYLRLGHRAFFGFWPDFDNPRTLGEHIMSLMLRCRDPILKIAADKVSTREYVAQHLGPEYVVPSYGVWDRADDVPLHTLPRPCVLKPSAASGRVAFLRTGVDADLDELRATLRRWLKRDYSRHGREWAYEGIKQRVLVEQMLLGPDGEPPADYKLWVIGKKVRMVTVDRDRFTRRTRNVYSADWQRLDVTQYPCTGHPTDPRPKQLARMIEVAEQLAAPFEFLRVDLYLNGDDALYVGELTATPGGGYERFEPASFERELASHWPPVEGVAAAGSAPVLAKKKDWRIDAPTL
jgi:hypothetical protein